MGLTQEEIKIMDQIAGTSYDSSHKKAVSISDADFNNMSKIAEEVGYTSEDEIEEPDLKTQIINEDPERAKKWQSKGEMSPYDLARSEAMSYYGLKDFNGTYDNVKAPRDPAEMNAMGKAVSAYLGEHLPYIKSGLKKLNNKLNSLVDTEAMTNSQPRDYRAESWINMSNKIAVEMTPDKQEDLTKKIGFLDGLKGNIIEGTSLGALVNGIEDAQARSAAKKILNNEPIYQGELDALNLAVDRQKENIVRQYTPLGKVGQAVGYSMGFTLDLMLGSALFRSLGLGTKANALAQGATKSEKVGQIAEGVTQAVVEPVLTTLLNAPIRANQMYQERMLNQELAITKNGYAYLSEAEEKPATAFFKSLQQLYIEYFTEIVGGKILGAAMNAGGKVASKATTPIMNNVFKKYPALKTVLDKTTIAFAKKYEELNKMPIVGKSTGWVKNVAHFDGFLEECGEEALADVLNIVLGTNYEDRTLKNYAKAVFKTPEEWGVIAGAILLQGAGLSAASFVLGNNMAERNLPKEDIEEALTASETEKEKLVEDLISSGELNIDADTSELLKGGVTYTRYKNELIKQGADEQQADNSAQLIEQAYRVIADKFGNEGIEHLKNANLQVIINNNNAKQIQAEEEILDTIMSEEEKSDKLMQFSVDELKTDAKTFQYKGNSNSEGVLDQNGLEGVEKWDNKVSGKVFVYENKKGERFIADGHQRLGLAKRLKDPNIKLDGYLFREADGFTPAQVRTLAAYKNIGEKSGTPLDAAKIIKEVGLEKLPKTIPMNSTLFKDGVSLSRLGDVAFEKVVNEEIPMNYAARVADAIKEDESKQAAAIDLIRKYYVEGKVPNAERAYNIASDINSAPTNVVEQINLFGTQEITQLLYVEKAEIVDTAVKDLQTNKKLFLKASKNKGKLESKGKTKIDKAASEMTAREAAIAAEIIQHRAYVAGDISEKANELAQKVKDGEIKVSEAVKEFEDFVLTPKILKEITGYTRKSIKYNQAAIDKAENISDLLSEDEAGTITPLEFYQKGFYQGAAKDVTETTAFKNWFGDSKVVDEDGKPLVVYHGSVNTFEIFDKDRASAEGDMGAGFYFTDNEWDADDNYHAGGADFDNKIARRAEQIQSEREEEGEDIDYEEAKELAEKELRGEPHQFSVYLKMEKPCYVGENETRLISDLYDDIDINEEDYETEDEYYEARQEAEDEVLQTLSYELDDALGGLLQYNDIERAKEIVFEYSYEGVSLQKLKDRLNEEVFEDWDTGDIVSNEVARKIVEALGYDGIIDSTPAEKFRGMNIPYGTTHYIVFDPTQIKDVNNNGEFNPTNPNIYYQAAYHGTPHNFAKFSTENIGTGEGATAHGWGLYFADNKEVSEEYRKALSEGKSKWFYGDKEVSSIVKGADIGLYKRTKIIGKKEMLEGLNKRLKDAEEKYKKTKEEDDKIAFEILGDFGVNLNQIEIDDIKRQIKIVEGIDESKIEYKEVKGQLLRVDIPENDVLLEEDMPLSVQPEKVQESIKKLYTDLFGIKDFSNENINNEIKEAEKNIKEREELTAKGNKTGEEQKRLYDLWKEEEKLNLLLDFRYDDTVAKDFYKHLAKYVSDETGRAGQKQASLKLNEYGIKGITYDGRQDGRCYVVFDDKAINILDRYYQEKENQEGEKAPRGQFRIDENGSAIIDILQNGDASTIVHELGHFYLYSVEQLSQKNKRAEKEFNDILEHYGFTAEDLKDYDKLTDLHEKFARGFEAYLLEGSAPTKKMLKVFKNFKLWLRDIYNSVKDLDVDFSEASQKLFDRIFTTDEEYEKEVLPKYQYNYQKVLEIEQAKNEPAYQLKESLNNGKNFISTWYDKIYLPLDTRLGKLAPELKQKLRKHTAALAAITGKDLKTTTVFLNAVSEIKKQSPEDYYKLDLALKNRDSLTVNMVCEKYNLKKDFEAVRDILDDIYTEALEVGLDVGYLENYYPRQVKRNLTDKFIEYIEALERKEQLDIANQVLKLEDAKISLVLREMKEANNSQFWTQEDKAKFLNNRIRGFGQNNILLGRNGSLKYDRSIDELDGNFNQFYEPMEVALVNYISSSRKTIEARKFFGGEDREVGKLRARIKRKKATLAEVQDRTPYQAKLKEENRIKYELSPLEIKLEALEKQDYIDNTEYKEKVQKKVDRLKSQLEWTEKANPFQVKGVVIKRLKDEIYEAAKQIKDIIGDEEHIEDSIGQLVAKLAQNGDIIAKDEREIREMLVARFSVRKISDPARILRDTTYIATLNDITNAITQFGDLAFSVYKFGFENTYKGLMKPFEIRKEDLGLNDLAYEFSNESLLSKWLKKQFDLIGLSKIDGLGKNTYIQASILDAQKQIKKNNTVFDNKLKALFGDNIEEVKKDLLEGKTTDNTIIFTFNELADIQPISEDQTPELYNNGSDYMRLFYTLKTYGIKALDVARNDITMKIEEGIKTKNKKLTKEGLKNLVRLQMLLWLFGVPIDGLKDLLANRDFNLFETVIDNLIPAFLINRYMVRIAGREGVGSAVVSFFSPACISVAKNILNFNKYTITNIPFIGKPLYNWGIKEK